MKSLFLKAVILLLIPVTLYFLITKALPKLIVTELNYTPYYWFRAPWLFVHTVFGIIATLVGPFQFVPAIRNRYWNLHRSLGKIYLISVGIAALSAIYLSLTSAITISYTIGLIVGALVWLFTGTMAYRLIRQKKVQQHRQWMVRNYVVTFFFIIFFGFYDLFMFLGIGNFEQLASILPWACLIIPLTVTEFILSIKNNVQKV